MRWHIEWVCDQAAGEFSLSVAKHPQREHEDVREQRFETAQEAIEQARKQRCGGEDKPKQLDSIDDCRGSKIAMNSQYRMPYQGCRCLLLGAQKIGDEAYNKAMDFFKDICPVANDWGYMLKYKIEQVGHEALMEISTIVSTDRDSKPLNAKRDHFPKSQQDLLSRYITSAVKEAKEVIQTNKGAPGPVAKAAAQDAELQFHRSRNAAWRGR